MPSQSEPVRQESLNPLLRPLANERGLALLLALAMLAIMTVIGVFALDTSTTEVQISGNYRTSQEAFFAADRAAMFALGHAKFDYKGLEPGETTQDLRAKNTRFIANFGQDGETESGAGNAIVAAGSSHTSLKSGTVENIFQGTGVGDGMGEGVKVGYYLINAVVGGPNGSEARIEVQSRFYWPKNSAEFEF